MRKTVVSFDLLRVAAALMVVFYHFFFYSWTDNYIGGIGEILGRHFEYKPLLAFTSWGWVGVYIFFVISGFFISMSVGGKTAAEFAIGRLLRICPALFFFSTLAAAIVIAISKQPVLITVHRWLNAVILFPTGPWVDGSVWTLTIEFSFYLIMYAFLFFRYERFIGRTIRFFTYFSSLIWVVYFYLRNKVKAKLSLHLFVIANSYTLKLTLITTGSFFIVGMMIYEIYLLGYDKDRILFLFLSFLSSIAALYNFSLVMPGVKDFDQSPLVPILVWAGAVAIMLAAIFVEGRHRPAPIYRTVIRQLGLMTYPIYLANQITGAFVVACLIRFGCGLFLSPMLGIAGVMMISFAFSSRVEPGCRSLIERTLRGSAMISAGSKA